MKRREFITLLGGAAAWPLAGRAQQPAMPVVGFLRSTSLAPFESLATAFRQGLNETGFVEGQNVAVEYRYADNQHERLPALVADLLRRSVAVIVANNASALAAISGITTVPIVFATGGDPVRDGLVASLNRPGGNVTGVVFFSSVLAAKRLELLRQLVPQATTIAVLVNPNLPNTEAEHQEVQAAAQAIGQQLVIVEVEQRPRHRGRFCDASLQRGAGALLVGSRPILSTPDENTSSRWRPAMRLPAIYGLRESGRCWRPDELWSQPVRMPIARLASTSVVF